MSDDTAQTSTTNTITNNVHQASSPGVSQTPACSICKISFDDAQAQRHHMKSAWHVYNLKRKIALLPVIALDVFESQLGSQLQRTKISHVERVAKDDEEDAAIPHRCLFCHQSFDETDRGLEDNLKHMSQTHSFFTPNIDNILDIGSFLGFLATAVRLWHECLYCGTVRDNTIAIQSHMRDKEHCKLNLNREPELLEFWEDEVQQNISTRESNTFLAHTSGSTAMARVHRQRDYPARSNAIAIALHTDAIPQSQRQLARRDELGLQGVAPQQRQALIVATRRSQKDQAIAWRTSEWSSARKANKQKHDQAHGPLSWAKGGLHNLLPR